MNAETVIMKQIQVALAVMPGVTVWRSNTGILKDEGGRPIRFGLGTGSADLVGFIHGTGRLFALEVKTATGRVSADQRTWLSFVASKGGYAAVVRSVADATEAVEAAERGLVAPDTWT